MEEPQVSKGQHAACASRRVSRASLAPPTTHTTAAILPRSASSCSRCAGRFDTRSARSHCSAASDARCCASSTFASSLRGAASREESSPHRSCVKSIASRSCASACSSLPSSTLTAATRSRQPARTSRIEARPCACCSSASRSRQSTSSYPSSARAASPSAWRAAARSSSASSVTLLFGPAFVSRTAAARSSSGAASPCRPACA
mmetsp:Transcript_15578/g.39092  ORF Transcript_15578/g.39092 Transcript_15578/m.39092 type:complete len:204 (-) Transcript_15578:202-813(-)